uniref:Uncharacterized protein n=1 Tax=Sphaerodactylus townsendi TaxID=933632 RepID=A0ACB8FJ89_9SAUR
MWGVTYVFEYFSQISQRLPFYSWYGSARLFRFRVPEDTAILHWLLQASRGSSPNCGRTQVTVHIRSGAPPIINPLGTQFPANMSLPGFYSQTLTLAASQENTTFLNLTSPAAGDWFIVAHLPEESGKIEVKGFSTPCTYTFQPSMSVLRVLGMPVLEPNIPIWQTISGPSWPLHTKLFVPEYSASLKLELRNCTANISVACTLHVTLGSATLPRSFQKVLNCTGEAPCSLLLASVPWQKWLRITVKSLSSAGASVSFQMTTSFVVCQPGGPSAFQAFYKSLNRSQAGPLLGSSVNATWQVGANASSLGNSCLHSQPVTREDLDTVSVVFRVLGEPSVPVWPQLPTVLLFNLDSGMDSGGTLVLSLQLNKTSQIPENATVLACLSAASPVLDPNAMWDCRTAFSQGYPLNMSASSPAAALSIPYPESDRWFLSLHLVCPKDAGECNKVKALVTVTASLRPCFDDCGAYGQCSLLRRLGYLYAACSCKAGWSGWSCTDGTKALSVGGQLLATLLLTLSNLLFLPAIVVAVYSYHLVEASVYLFTMFFSTFYHACDQPGVAILCIMDYDTLQFCDFLGSVVSIWVTILCMAQLKKMLKYILGVLGTLFIAMSLQLDRRGVWNIMGPCLLALVIMISVWVYRGVKRRHCYPPSWKRWAFFLCPGISLALIAIAIYAFMETNENYYYTHSLWHVLMAGCVAFLLPPGDKVKRLWVWSRKLLCGYQICNNDQEELYAVT